MKSQFLLLTIIAFLLPLAAATHAREPFMVKDIYYIGSSGSNPWCLTNVNGTLFFQATDGPAKGIELWKSDGTEANTVMVKDINPGSAYSSPQNLTNLNGFLFFSATDVHGNELWTYDAVCQELLLSDLNKDCRVDFLDFALMASEWLSCNMYQPDLCW